MSAPAPQCQPKGVEYLRWLASPDAERMSEYWRINEFVRSGLEAADGIEELKARAEQAERSVDVLESNAREQAKLLADTGRRVEELEHPFRAVDDLDWRHLLSFIPDSGHGRFWKAVFAEVRAALQSSAPEVSQ